MSQHTGDSRKKPVDSFVEIFETFGDAMSEIFNDPALKEKAKDLGKSARESAEAFTARFKDEDVKRKFRDVGQAAQEFGRSLAELFREGKGGIA